ncbi:MAG: DUF4157 domain-containing protein [Alphaproteobacteria bacterium]|nr:DUF4157 domain-containing protein [Alphaproteobacteria bacterium]
MSSLLLARRAVLATAAATLLWSGNAFAGCPSDHYREPLTKACVPKFGGEIAKIWDVIWIRIRREHEVESVGPILASWLQKSRDSARQASRPIPQNIREQLEGFVDVDVLNAVEYKVGDSGFLNLGGLITRENHAHAVTLVDTIVFDRAWDAENNARLWAHELFHVMQFRKWGTSDFAKKYVRDYNSVEEEAYAFDSEYETWVAAKGILLPPRADGKIPLAGGVVLLGNGYFIRTFAYRHKGPSPHRHEFMFQMYGPGGKYLGDNSYVGQNDQDWRLQTDTFYAGSNVVRYAFADWNDGWGRFNFTVESQMTVPTPSIQPAPFRSTSVSLNGGTAALESGYELRNIRYGHRGPGPHDHWFTFEVHGPGGLLANATMMATMSPTKAKVGNRIQQAFRSEVGCLYSRFPNGMTVARFYTTLGDRLIDPSARCTESRDSGTQVVTILIVRQIDVSTAI